MYSHCTIIGHYDILWNWWQCKCLQLHDRKMKLLMERQNIIWIMLKFRRLGVEEDYVKWILTIMIKAEIKHRQDILDLEQKHISGNKEKQTFWSIQQQINKCMERYFVQSSWRVLVLIRRRTLLVYWSAQGATIKDTEVHR